MQKFTVVTESGNCIIKIEVEADDAMKDKMDKSNEQIEIAMRNALMKDIIKTGGRIEGND